MSRGKRDCYSASSSTQPARDSSFLNPYPQSRSRDTRTIDDNHRSKAQNPTAENGSLSPFPPSPTLQCRTRRALLLHAARLVISWPKNRSSNVRRQGAGSGATLLPLTTRMERLEICVEELVVRRPTMGGRYTCSNLLFLASFQCGEGAGNPQSCRFFSSSRPLLSVSADLMVS